MSNQRQPEINIGMVGHVDHGKTTLTKALTGKWADRHSEEIKRGISIKLGYADANFYKCPKCNEPERYTIHDKCKLCGEKTERLRAVSFVDSPGHETLMATMLSGASIMDGALLLIAANETCPQPQTKEHLMALNILGIKKIVIVQNKIDLVDEKHLMENYGQIKNFVKGTVAENAPIIPVSAQHFANIDVLIKMIEETIPTPKRDKESNVRMHVARSFDVNMPGNRVNTLVGGVIGGTLSQGRLSIGDKIGISPCKKTDEKGRELWGPVITEVTTLISDGKKMKSIGPGGLIGAGTTLDPAMTKSDALAGKIAGAPDTLPPVLDKIVIEANLLERVVGSAEDLKVEKIKTREVLMLNAGVTTTAGVVTSAREKDAEVTLKLPICADKGQRIAISRRIGGRWRLIGYGIIK
ncbi:MAG: translation initiation factor IF-2 subunit gamma [Euryarchaeota archaeon CG01_land_8_20_14_3_00_38_12]|nr:MAG: translation initiation factor IF-2 subunit gamma [Euryarchaeota archaeon CG01_land_8_20_14_3_00_38_12]